MIYPVDEKYQVPIPYNNPRHHRGKMIEAYALDYFKKNPVESEYTYLPIFWTGWHVSHGYGNPSGVRELQTYVDTIPKGKYWMIVQYDDGLLVNFPCVTFCGAFNGDYAIPVLCDRHQKISVQRARHLISFSGNLKTNPVRSLMYGMLNGKPGVVIRTNTTTRQFVNLACQSTFALCPRGYGNTSFRMYEVMGLGCIPIYISDKFWLPFADKIDWEKCAMLVTPNKIPEIPRCCRQMSEVEIRERQEYIARINDEFFTMEKCCEQIANIVKGLK